MLNQCGEAAVPNGSVSDSLCRSWFGPKNGVSKSGKFGKVWKVWKPLRGLLFTANCNSLWCITTRFAVPIPNSKWCSRCHVQLRNSLGGHESGLGSMRATRAALCLSYFGYLGLVLCLHPGTTSTAFVAIRGSKTPPVARKWCTVRRTTSVEQLSFSSENWRIYAMNDDLYRTN